MSVSIIRERPDSPDSIALIEELEAVLEPLYPSASRHGYSVEKLIRQKVAFFVLRKDCKAAACGGVQLFDDYAEVKRMYVRQGYRGEGFAKQILNRLADYSRENGIRTLRLETGIYQMEAVGLYERWGFHQIAPFGDYIDDPNSLFYEKILD